MTPLRAGPRSDGQLKVPRTADVVADRIRELIVTGQLADGERLPSLHSLLDEFGISGPTMREVLRMLESEGLITVQRGKIGGAIVHRPSYTDAASTMALVLRSHDTAIADVAMSLEILERQCAMLCARRPDRARTVVPALRELNETARALVDSEELTFTEAMTAFHEELMRGCGLASLALGNPGGRRDLARGCASVGRAQRRPRDVRHPRGTRGLARSTGAAGRTGRSRRGSRGRGDDGRPLRHRSDPRQPTRSRGDDRHPCRTSEPDLRSRTTTGMRMDASRGLRSSSGRGISPRHR